MFTTQLGKGVHAGASKAHAAAVVVRDDSARGESHGDTAPRKREASGDAASIGQNAAAQDVSASNMAATDVSAANMSTSDVSAHKFPAVNFSIPDGGLVTSSMPRLFIGVIAALWAGAALVDAMPWFDLGRAVSGQQGAPAAELHQTLALCGVVLALGSVVCIAHATRIHRQDTVHAGHTRTDPVHSTLRPAQSAYVNLRAARVKRQQSLMQSWPAISLLLLAAVMLGLAIRTQQIDQERAFLEFVFPNEDRASGTLVEIEGTVDEEFSTRGFAVDILSRHFEKEPIHRCVLRDIRFIEPDQSLRETHSIVESANTQRDGTGDRATNALKDCRLSVSISGTRPSWRVADRVRVIGVLRGVAENSNPHTRNLRAWAARNNVYGSLFVESADVCTVLTDPPSTTPIRDWIARLRASLRENLRAGLLAGVAGESGGEPIGGTNHEHSYRDAGIRSMLVALVLGDTGEGYAEIENAFRATGLAHILAISGFNLAVLGWIVGTFARMIFRDTRFVAVCVMSGAAVALFVMAPAPSAERSALMAIVGSMGSIFRRDWHGDAILAVVAGWMIVSDPGVASNAGFQLSFACVIALRHLAPRVRRVWLDWIPGDAAWQTSIAWRGILGDYCARAIASGVAAFCVGTSIALAHFGTMQPAGILLTFLCAPLSTATLAIAYPKAIVGSLAEILVWPLGYPLYILLSLQIAIVDETIALGGGGWTLQEWVMQPIAARVLFAGSTLCGVILLLCAKRWWLRMTACTLVVLGVWVGPTVLHASFNHRSIGSDEGEPTLATMTTFSIGDGSAHLFACDESLVIFDVGSSSIGSTASRIMLPEIRARGGVVEALIISHPDLDHFSGAADIMRFARVRRLIVHDSMIAAAERAPPVQELIETANRHGVSLELVSAGDKLHFGCSTWNVLWPPKEMRSLRDNDVSLVMRVDLPTSSCKDLSAAEVGLTKPVDASQYSHTQRGAVLLCGDIETFGCASLLAKHVGEEHKLNATVMELPHHGSWRDAVVPLIHRCDPSVIVQSTAARRFRMDRFGGVLPTTSSRLVTCRDGAIRIEFRTQDVRAFVYDELAAHHWRPSGRWQRSRRPRVTDELLRRLRRQISAWRQERRALQNDSVANDAVSTVAQRHNDSRLRVGRSADHEGLRTGRAIEDESLAGAALKSDGDFQSHVRRCGFHDADDSRQQCVRQRFRGRDLEANGARSFNRDIGASEQKSFSSRNTPQIGRAIKVTTTWLANLFRRTRRKWSESAAIKNSCNWISRTVVRGWLRTSLEKPVTRELESPTAPLVESQISRSDERAIRCPDFKSSSRIRGHFSQSDRGDAVHCNRSSRYSFWRRTRFPVRRVRGLARWLIGCLIGSLIGRRSWLASTWPRRVLCGVIDSFVRIGSGTSIFRNRREWCCGNGEVFADRFDEPAYHIAVDEKHCIRVSSLRCPSIRDHSEVRYLLKIDGQCSDPTVIPVGDAIDDSKRAWNALTIDRIDHTEREWCDAQERAFTLLPKLSVGTDRRAQSLTTDDKCDDLGCGDVPLRDRARVTSQDRPRIRTDRLKSPESPSTIAKQNAHDCGIGFITNNGCGVGCPFPLRFLRFFSDTCRKDHLSLQSCRAQRGTHQHERCDNNMGFEDRSGDERIAALLQGAPRKSNQHRVPRPRQRVRRFPGRWLRRISHCSPLALEDGEVSLRHLEHDEGHRGAIRVADLLVGPRTVRILLGDEFLADRRPPILPSFATSEIHRLNRVVVPVKVVLLGKSNSDPTRTAWERVARQVVESAIDRLILVDAGIKEARDARRCARPRRSAYLFHVSESPVVVLTRSNVSDRVVDRRLRNFDSSVARTSECHDLADRDRDVGIRGNRVVAPASLVVLATHDELHGADQRVTNPIVVLVHPVNLTEEQRRESVAVHRSMRVVGDEKTSFGGVRENEIECLLDAVAKLAASGHIAVRHQSDCAQAGDTNMFAESALTEGAIRLLHPAQRLEPALDRFLKLRRNLLGKRCVLRTLHDRARRLDSALLGRIRGLLRSRGLTLVLSDEVTHDDGRGNESCKRGNGESSSRSDVSTTSQTPLARCDTAARWNWSSGFTVVAVHDRQLHKSTVSPYYWKGRSERGTLWRGSCARGPPNDARGTHVLQDSQHLFRVATPDDGCIMPWTHLDASSASRR